MSKINLNVLFKKIQKDDKKQVLEYHVQGDELPSSQELVQLAGSIAVIEVEGSEAGPINAEFKSIQRDSKKTALKFYVTGGNDDTVIKLYPFAGSSVNLTIQPSQMSLEEFYDEDEHEGVAYTVENDGSFSVPDGQLSLDDIPFGEEGNVTHDDDELN